MTKLDNNLTELELLPVCKFCGYVFRDGIEIKYYYKEIGNNKTLSLVEYKPNVCPSCKRGICDVYVSKVKQVNEDEI